ncbi:tRNA (adenosine(37)-N6)-threonylcarbamoyltransferase complex ATPase subunit type 1 TsaE [Alphaproteobacteria bacterium]|nr:tRNA (adenosine(37)-N6)-threonylcarbamoyltransferase complex ATPase subunit type 1 TsaE [Alphaproteobacteria bacterium]
MNVTFSVHQESDLAKVVDKISPLLQHQQILFFEGEVGSGKTTFIRYLLESLAKKTKQEFHFLGSPTYQREHDYNLKKLNLVHFDFYQVDQKTHIDLEDYFMDNCLLVEWPSKDLKKRYLPDALLIKMKIEAAKRIIEINSQNPKWLP